MGGSLNLEILRRGLKQFWKFRWKGWGGGVKKPCLLLGGGVRIFSGITQYIASNHMYFFFSSVLIIMFMAQSGARMPIKINNRL